MAEIIQGVGPDAEIVTNELGAQQSKLSMVLDVIPNTVVETLASLSHLVDYRWAGPLATLARITWDDERGNAEDLFAVLGVLLKSIPEEACPTGNERTARGLAAIGKVLERGERKYGPGNWWGISPKDHVRHAIAHLLAYGAGDRQEPGNEHLTHAACRVAFAYEILVGGGAKNGNE